VEDRDLDIEKLALVRVLRLQAMVQGIVSGLLAAVGLFAATNYLVLKGGEVVGPHLALLSQFFPGYTVTFVGSIVGAIYAFAYGFAAGYFVSRVYNAMVARRLQAR